MGLMSGNSWKPSEIFRVGDFGSPNNVVDQGTPELEEKAADEC